MKKLFAFVLALALVLAMVPLSAGAAEVAASGTCGDNLTWTLDSDGLLTISGTGEMAHYAEDAPWYELRDSVKALKIEDGVTSIGRFAFYRCTGLTEVVIPDSVTTIAASAFCDCSGLVSVTIPNSVTSIETGAFGRCTSLTGITLPETITSIGPMVFEGCTSLTSITIPDGVDSIELDAFYGCTSLATVTIPESVTWIAGDSFKYTPWLASLGDYAIVNDILLQYQGSDTEIVIPAGVTLIAQDAFYNCTEITSVTIPDGVTRLGAYAFWDCTKLAKVTVPATVTQIGAGAFENTPWLASLGDFAIINNLLIKYQGSDTEVVIPEGVTSVEQSAFDKCSEITSVTIPDSVTNLGVYAFLNCTKLTNITIPASVTSIGGLALGYYLDMGYKKVDGFTITGYAGTAAETYAEDNDLTFIPLDEKEAPEFNDVKESDWYYTPVQWAVANNVTAGTSDTTFSPSNKCTREQAVTFLWNAKGQPEPEGTENPFTDVKEGAWYYKAVLWAVENNITAGVSADKFGVGQPCTRGQIVTFFYNYAERPAASGTNPFTDVPSSQWYYEPVLWAVSNGVTAGMTPTTFGPTSTCTRGQIVTFLYNYLGK